MRASCEDNTTSWPAPGQPGCVEFGLGDVIDRRYAVRGVVGHGGMGQVLRVECLADRRIYALKYCRVSGQQRKRFAREVALMRGVRHRHVVPVLHANLRHEPPYFVMPMAECSLEAEREKMTGDEARVLAIFRQIGLGVGALHDSGIVHRDLKPANVLRFKGNRFAVADLGLAKRDASAGGSSELTRTRTVLGTLAFLAPEQLLPSGSRRADVRTDIYQLGKVLYRLLTGLPPALIDPEALPKGLAHIIQRATSADPEGRYRSLGELLDALRYYELAKDPAKNSREARENLFLQAEAALKSRQRPFAIVAELLALLGQQDGVRSDGVLASFDRIPDRLLPFVAREFSREFLPILRTYADALRAKAARCEFGYADIVARRMRLVFRHSGNDELACFALRTVLLASVALNRFAAMSVFNRLLTSVKTCDLGLRVAEMLRDDAEYYREVAGAVLPAKLHPAIRAVQEEVLGGHAFPTNVPDHPRGRSRSDYSGRDDFSEKAQETGRTLPKDPQNRRGRFRPTANELAGATIRPG